jgi:hypothetical protein
MLKMWHTSKREWSAPLSVMGSFLEFLDNEDARTMRDATYPPRTVCNPCAIHTNINASAGSCPTYIPKDSGSETLTPGGMGYRIIELMKITAMLAIPPTIKPAKIAIPYRSHVGKDDEDNIIINNNYGCNESICLGGDWM